MAPVLAGAERHHWLELQREVAADGAALPVDRRIRLRIGLNVGEVISEPEDIFGTSVNEPPGSSSFPRPLVL
jgi:class 3 adenylate cyclase